MPELSATYPISWSETGDKTNEILEKHKNEIELVIYPLLNKIITRWRGPNEPPAAAIQVGLEWDDTTNSVRKQCTVVGPPAEWQVIRGLDGSIAAESLPIATADALGAIMIGAGLYIASDTGILTAVNNNGGVRQTVLTGPVDSSGMSAFGGSTGGTTVTMSGTIIATAANGFGTDAVRDKVGVGTNLSWTGLTTNGTMYLDALVNDDKTLTPVARALVPIEQRGGTISTANGQFSFDIATMKGYLGDGSAANQGYEVRVGEVTVAGGVVTAITWYALRGEYDSGFFSVAASTNYTKSHNIGSSQISITGYFKFARDISNMLTDDVTLLFPVTYATSTTSLTNYYNYQLTTKAFTLRTATNIFNWTDSGGTGRNETSGAYRFVARREW